MKLYFTLRKSELYLKMSSVTVMSAAFVTGRRPLPSLLIGNCEHQSIILENLCVGNTSVAVSVSNLYLFSN